MIINVTIYIARCTPTTLVNRVTGPNLTKFTYATYIEPESKKEPGHNASALSSILPFSLEL